MSGLLALSLALPLALALALGSRGLRAAALAAAPWAPLPALVLALAAEDGTGAGMGWLLLGAELGLDGLGRPFLFATALVWLIAGWYARAWLRDDPRRAGFTAFFLVTQAANLAVCVALDAATFYFAFAAMTFAAYGLVVHAGDAAALRAGRIYIVMAVLGEALLVAGLLFAVSAAGSHRMAEIAAALAAAPHGALAAGLLFAGFGVKAGLPLLHVWLPLAHPVAPVPASAVLSGVMVKAGVIGWLRFLPLGSDALPGLGAVAVAAGVAAMFLGVVIGLVQRDAKVVLAYSTISQMGFLTAGVGAGLLAPGLWPLLWPAVMLYALHHALAKSALFLGVGVAKTHGGTRPVLLGLALPALALAGAPWTGGAWAKAALKTGLYDLPGRWPAFLDWTLPLAAVGTAVLMGHLLILLARETAHGSTRGLIVPWAASLAAVALIATWMALNAEAPWDWLDAAWPLLAAAVLVVVMTRLERQALQIPPGDVVVAAERVAARLRGRLPAVRGPVAPQVPPGPPAQAWLRLEARFAAWPVATGLWLILVATLTAILIAWA